MLRVVEEVRPSWVVAENVRGLLSIGNGTVFEEVCSSLESIGYAVQTFCIPACAVNAPHRRDRLWVIANSDGGGCQRFAGDSSIQREKMETAYRKRNASGFGDSDCNGFRASADPDDKRHDGRREQDKIGEREIYSGRGNDRAFGEPAIRDSRIAGTITDTDSERLQGFDKGADGSWLEVATRLCTVDDGLPNGLVRPKGWRANALKAAGNAIVPQIAYEIFKAIEYAEIN